MCANFSSEAALLALFRTVTLIYLYVRQRKAHPTNAKKTKMPADM